MSHIQNFEHALRLTAIIHRATSSIQPRSKQHVRVCPLIVSYSADEFARLIPKADRKKIHEYIFREGVLVAKKDYNKPQHDEIETKNLYVSLSVRHT